MELFTGKEYLKIDIANNFGLDKHEWYERIAWFDQNEHQLDTLVKQAEEPALFYAGIQAWKRVKEGKPNHYPISLDATSSGIQILACLTGDRKAAELCNVINVGKRMDAYKRLYDIMVDTIGDTAKIDRKDTKSAIMTAFYGSTAMPKQVFGEGTLLTAFHDTMKDNAPGAWELNETMLAIWDPEATINEWVMPDNFHVKVKVMDTVKEKVHFMNEPIEVSYSINKPIEQGRSLGANMTHSIDGMIVREMTRRCSYDRTMVLNVIEVLTDCKGKSDTREKDKMLQTLLDHYDDSGFMSARVLQYIDNKNVGNITRKQSAAVWDVINSLPSKPFNVIAVHDCFRCLPNYGNDLRKQYNQILSDIARSDMLSYIVSQILKRRITVNKLDSTMYMDILDADYALS